MILEDLLEGSTRNELANSLADLLQPMIGKKREDDIRVRAYIVRSHWRKRWHPKRHLKVVRA